MGPKLAMIVMDGGGLEGGRTVDVSFICLLQIVVQDGEEEDGRAEVYLVGVKTIRAVLQKVCRV